MTQNLLPPPADQEEMFQLVRQLNQTNEPDPQDTARLRQLASGMPDDFFALLNPVGNQLIGMISGGNGMIQALMLAETDRLKQQFGYDAAPPLERIMIDNILTLLLRLRHAEVMYNQAVANQTGSVREATYRDKLLNSAQMRYLKAIEMLAKIRRLSRDVPSLQINIAQEGGQQVNVQGEVSGQKVA